MFAIMVRPGGAIVAIAGNLRAEVLPELEAVLANGAVRVVDCAELRRVDREGAALLKRWRATGGAMANVSNLLALMLEAEPVAQFSEPDDRSVTR